MNEAPKPSGQKQPLPLALKVIIVLAIILVGGGLLFGIATQLIGGFLASKGGEEVLKRGVAEWMEHQAKQAGEDLEIKIKDGKVVVKDKKKGSEVEINIDDEGLVMRDTKSGQKLAFKAGTEIPPNFPQGIQHPADAQVVSSAMIGNMASVSLETNENPDQVFQYYQQQLTKNGWEKRFHTEGGAQSSSVYQNDAGRLTVSISQSAPDKNVHIALTFTPVQLKN